jgi:hypothetical protein
MWGNIGPIHIYTCLSVSRFIVILRMFEGELFDISFAILTGLDRKVTSLRSLFGRCKTELLRTGIQSPIWFQTVDRLVR